MREKRENGKSIREGAKTKGWGIKYAANNRANKAASVPIAGLHQKQLSTIFP